MQKNTKKERKVVVVGAGAVGATFCYALALSGLADEIILVDANIDLARGQALDLMHGQAFFPEVKIRAGSKEEYADAELIVITAGVAQRPGETRLQLLKKNAAVVRQITSEIMETHSEALVLMVTNPVDIMTYVALEHTGWKRNRVLGSGTVLDSARLRHLLSQRCHIDAHNVHGYVLGEHGDSEFVAWSMTNAGGISLRENSSPCGVSTDWLKERKEIETAVRESAYHIIDYKGATNFAVGLALVRIAAAILRGQRSVLTVSGLLEGEFGLHDVCLSVPWVVSEQGLEKVLEPSLPEEERALLNASAKILQKSIAELRSA